MFVIEHWSEFFKIEAISEHGCQHSVLSRSFKCASEQIGSLSATKPIPPIFKYGIVLRLR